MPKLKTPALTRKLVAREAVSNGFQMTKAVRVVKPHLTYKSATQTASRLLDNVEFMEDIKDELENRGITNELLDTELKFIIQQRKHLPSKLGAIVEANEMKDRKKTSEESKQYNFFFNNPQELSSKMVEIQDELNRIRNTGA